MVKKVLIFEDLKLNKTYISCIQKSKRIPSVMPIHIVTSEGVVKFNVVSAGEKSRG